MVKMKYLVINTVAGVGSTGKISADICRKLKAEGHDAVLAYGRDIANCDDIKTIRIGSMLDVYWHVAMTRLFDKHGLCSKRATRRFLKWVDSYKPDVIWLHNIHGYYLNYEELFSYIKRYNIKVKWTLHDCWALTGHCSYFTFVKCEQWKSHCSYCPQKRTYPGCWFNGRVDSNFDRKRKAFTGVKNLELIVPSNWLKGLVAESFLKDYPCTVVYNEIDRNIFKPTPSSFRKDFHLENKKIVLGVASVWTKRKGLEDFYKLSSMLDDSYVIVLVGLSKKQIKSLPKNIVGITRTNNQAELAGLYSTANIFVNPSREETFGLTSVEAVSCGTPSVVYEETACEEIAKSLSGGVAVPPGVENLYEAITGRRYIETNSSGGGCRRLIVFSKTADQNQLAQIYSAADYFANPTYEDNYPTVNLEALACECFVVTYDVGGCKETISNGFAIRQANACCEERI